jgi:2'-5' RNA ligase
MTQVHTSMTRIQQALDAGRSVHVIYVHRDPIEAWHEGVRTRAASQGRQTQLDYHVTSHVEGLATIKKLADAYGDHPNVQIEMIHNRTGEEPASIEAHELPEAYNGGDVRAGIEARQEAPEGRKSPRAEQHAEVSRDDGAQRPLSSPPEDRQEVAAEPPREFSSTQVDLPSADAQAIGALAKSIPDADLAADGRETDPHVTVKFGLHTADVEDVRRVLAGEPPITLTFGKTSIFPAKEGADYDVVKVDVDSPDLHRLNDKIGEALEHTDTHPNYKPHVTLAYVKPGLGQKYVGRTDLAGRTITLDAVAFSGKDRSVVSIPLTGDAATGDVWEQIQTVVDQTDAGDQPRLPGAESARQVGKADTSFKAPQQASGDDFVLGAEETPEAKATSEAAERGPSMFDDLREICRPLRRSCSFASERLCVRSDHWRRRAYSSTGCVALDPRLVLVARASFQNQPSWTRTGSRSPASPTTVGFGRLVSGRLRQKNWSNATMGAGSAKQRRFRSHQRRNRRSLRRHRS